MPIISRCPSQATQRYNQTLDRLDQNIGDKVRLYVRAHWQEWNTFGGSAVPVNSTTVPTEVRNYTVGYTHTLTPTLVNDLRVGRNFFKSDALNAFAVAGLNTAGSDLGIPGFTGDVQYNNPGIPDFNITGFNGLGTGGTNWYQNDSTHQISEQISWAKGSHNIMAGFEFRRLATGRAAVNSARGAFTFNGTQTGYAPADFILGNQVSFGTPGPEIRGRVAGWRDGFFVLDKWQVSRKLTLNYGLRYELPTVPYTINGNASFLNADQTALIVAEPGTGFIKPQHKNFAPRLGFAYRITEKTVFRGGAGIYYNPNQTNSYTFLNTNPPWATIFNCNWSSGLPTLSLSNPYAVSAACPAAGRQPERPDCHAPLGPGHRPNEPVERQSGTSTLGRWRLRIAVPRIPLLSSGPQLLQQHSGSRARPRQFTPAEQEFRRSHPHHKQRSDRQLRKYERHLPSANV